MGINGIYNHQSFKMFVSENSYGFKYPEPPEQKLGFGPLAESGRLSECVFHHFYHYAERSWPRGFTMNE